MEVQNLTKPAVFNMLGGAFSIFFKRLHVILGLVVVGGAVSLALVYAWWSVPVINAGGMVATLVLSILMNIVYALISAIVGLIFGLAMIRVLMGAIKGENVGFESLGYGLKNVWAGFMISLRIFYYVMFWPLLFLILVLLAFVVMKVFMGAGAFGQIAGASSLSSLGTDAPDLIMSTGTFQPSSLRSMIFSGSNMVLGVLGLVAVVMVIYFALVRGLKAMFSLYAFVSEGRTGKEALEYSKALVTGNWWMVFWKLLAAVLLLMLVLFVIAFVGAIATGGEFSFAVGSEQISMDQSLLKNALNQLISGVMGAIVVAYACQLFAKLKAYKGM